MAFKLKRYYIISLIFFIIILSYLNCDRVLALKPQEYYNVINIASPRSGWCAYSKRQSVLCVIIFL